MLFSRVFKKKQESVEVEAETSGNEEVILVSKSKYNKHGNQLKNRFLRQLREVTQSTGIKFKRVKIHSRIGEYDNLSFELISGMLYQLNSKLGNKELLIGELAVKTVGDQVDIQMNYINGVGLESLMDRKYRTSFGAWGVYEGSGISLSASFHKEKYREFIMGQRATQSTGRRRHV